MRVCSIFDVVRCMQCFRCHLPAICSGVAAAKNWSPPEGELGILKTVEASGPYGRWRRVAVWGVGARTLCLCVCVCVYLRVCKFKCMRVCLCVCMCLCVRLCVWVWVSVSVCVWVWVSMCVTMYMTLEDIDSHTEPIPTDRLKRTRFTTLCAASVSSLIPLSFPSHSPVIRLVISSHVHHSPLMHLWKLPPKTPEPFFLLHL